MFIVSVPIHNCIQLVAFIKCKQYKRESKTSIPFFGVWLTINRGDAFALCSDSSEQLCISEGFYLVGVSL